MKKVVPLVVVLATTVAACDMTATEQEQHTKTSQRDVYHSLEDCVADWGDTELCQEQMKEAREHQEKMAAAQAQSGSGASIIPIPMFFGPSYVGERSVVHNGREITPSSTKAARTATIVTNPATNTRTFSYNPPRMPSTPASVSAARAGGAAAVSSAARGGFGSGGGGATASGGASS